MKTHLKTLSIWFSCVAACAMLTSCGVDPIIVQRGDNPDREQLENTFGLFRSARVPGPVVTVGLSEGSGTYTDKVYYRISRPSQSAVNLTAAADLSLVEAYNEEHGSSFSALPAANVTLASGGAISIPVGDRRSGQMGITVSADGLAPGTYLLPIKVSEPSGITQKRNVVYYMVRVRELSPGDYPLDREWMTVFYVDVNEVQPLLADYANMEVTDMSTWESETVTLGNIVVLRNLAVGYNAASGRALLSVNANMRYVLEHAGKYIRPLQDKGRKVLACVQGEGSGLGFCNMNDGQIADFVAQAAALIKEYGLDGINLWDENSGYGKAGMPATNSTSYPKLIKAMREALPEGTLLTLTDKGDPTASFYDTSLTGGIAVGDHIDYAWSGYWSYNEEPQYVYPWRNDDESDRKPIAGLTEDKYGNIMYPSYPDNSDVMQYSEWIDIELDGGGILEQWTTKFEYDIFLWSNKKRNNNIIVFADLPISSINPWYEAGYVNIFDLYFNVFYIYDIEWFDQSKMIAMADGDIFRSEGYGTFGKDW